MNTNRYKNDDIPVLIVFCRIRILEYKLNGPVMYCDKQAE